MVKIDTKIGWLLYDEKIKRVLIHRRDHKPEGSKDAWDCFGGNIEKNETQYEAFLRELCEELGVSVKKEKVWVLSNYENHTVYCVPFDMDNTPIIRLGEGAGFAFLPIDYVFGLDITEEAKNILEAFIKTKIGSRFVRKRSNII